MSKKSRKKIVAEKRRTKPKKLKTGIEILKVKGLRGAYEIVNHDIKLEDQK